MIPIHDNIPSRTTAVVNYSIIAVCCVVFLAQLAFSQQSALIEELGMIPARVLNPDQPVQVVDRVPVQTRVRELSPSLVPAWMTVVTCVFLHGGWMHIIGNLWFLHIFGDNVEDRFGHLGYLCFYMACGIAASLCHLAAGPQSTVPTIGASGAIAGVMGAYFVLYPKAQVLSILPIFVFIQVLTIPAPIFLGVWFGIQFFQGTLSVDGGVAWWAHIGGFVAGVAIALIAKYSHLARPPVLERTHTRNSRNRQRPPSWRSY